MAEEIEGQEEVENIEVNDEVESVADDAESGDDGQEQIAAEEEKYAQSFASRMGWVPKDQWRGDPSEWRPAAEFISSTVDVNKSIRKQLKATQESAERAARAAAAITERALEEQRQKILAERQEAFDAGDRDAFNQADEQLQKLPQSGQHIDPAVAEFTQRNAAWFRVDPIATQMALNIAELQARSGADPATQVAEAEKMIRKRFPEYFEEEQKPAKRPASVEISGSRSSSPAKGGAKGFNELPADARAAALDYERRGRATKEEYAKIYWQENA